MFDIHKIRQEFPLLQQQYNQNPIIYFDNAATSQKPKSVIRAIQDYYENYNANIHRGMHFLAEKSTMQYESARETVQKFINARESREIIFTKNATEAINLVAFSYVDHFLKKGDEIVLSYLEHHSNFLPWLNIAQKKGLKIKLIELNQEGRLELRQLDQIFSKKTKFVAISQASNVLGTENPVKEIIRYAQNYEAKTLIDASQSAPHRLVDVQQLDCDFLVFTGHKVCGPTGTGVLFGKVGVLQKMPPWQCGGGMIAEATCSNFTPGEIPEKFEAGTPHLAGVIGLKSALEYLQNFDLAQFQAHEKELTEYMLQELLNLDFIKLHGSTNSQARLPIFSFTIKDIHPHDISELLSSFGICIRAGRHCAHPLLDYLKVNATARASLYFYNTTEEINLFIDGLKKVREVFA
jgi:cysteine desulfurase/selenocysteine lyase